MDWSPQQTDAIGKAQSWLNSSSSDQIFRLFGYAGTGKTTLLRHLVEGVKGSILYGAYTGKAAHVMRKNGIPASTIHQMIYNVEPPNAAEFSRLKQELKSVSDPEETAKLRELIRELSQPSFNVNMDSAAAGARLIVLDEVSMVYEEMAKDLLGFDVPILVLGDPGQLPPVKGTGYFTEAQPDVMLTEIHRQAADNPIIKLATMARKGQSIDYGEYGDSSVIRRYDWIKERAMRADQVLTGKNATRRTLNLKLRGLHRHTDELPEVGEKLICLKNIHDKGLLNGMQCHVVEVGEDLGISVALKLEMENGRELELVVTKAHFEEYYNRGAVEDYNTNYPYWMRKHHAEFDYGYAITVHKSQGSQWDHVTLVDDRFGRDPETRNRWLYTAITRAAETITIVR